MLAENWISSISIPESYFVKFPTGYFGVGIPVPGADKEDIKVSVNKCYLQIDIQSSIFVEEFHHEIELNFAPKKEDIVVYIEKGVLHIDIYRREPGDCFEVEIN